MQRPIEVAWIIFKAQARTVKESFEIEEIVIIIMTAGARRTY